MKNIVLVTVMYSMRIKIIVKKDLMTLFQENNILGVRPFIKVNMFCSDVCSKAGNQAMGLGKLRQRPGQHDNQLTTGYPSSHLINRMFCLMCEYSQREKIPFNIVKLSLLF